MSLFFCVQFVSAVLETLVQLDPRNLLNEARSTGHKVAFTRSASMHFDFQPPNGLRFVSIEKHVQFYFHIKHFFPKQED